MNAVTLVIGAALVLVLAYRYYGAFLAAKVLTLNEANPVPSVRFEDGKDYVPTNKWIVMGHHFAAIAGAGPLIGPVLAAQFGYLPGTLWILVGAVGAGAVHDMVVLAASVRHDGLSLAEIAKRELSSFSGGVTSVAIILILITAMAGLALGVINALFKSPWGVFTVSFTIPVALLVGLYYRVLRPGRIGEASVLGVVLVLLGVVLGPVAAHSWLAPYLTLGPKQITLWMVGYGFVAAVLPVWLLLAPRDYLSTYMKIGTIALLAIGVIIVHPVLQMPAVTKYISGGGPIIGGKVWPFLFITIACGAVSGFHALIASGTTPKMLTNEKDIRMIGYGGMLIEAFVAIMALVAATSLHPADYFAINVPPAVYAKLGMAVQNLPLINHMVAENLAGRPGGAVSLAAGMAQIFANIPGMKFLMSYWYHFAIMFEALFILTTIDAGTRVGRYLLQEAGGRVYRPLGDSKWWPGVILTSLVMSAAWGYLVYGGSISTIWPLFGTANQLLATLALAIGTSYLVNHGKAAYAWLTFLPMCFMAVTAVTAGILNVTTSYLPKHNYLLVVVSVLIVVLVLAVIVDSVYRWLAKARPGTDLPLAG